MTTQGIIQFCRHLSGNVPRCPPSRSGGSRQRHPGEAESPATTGFAVGHGKLRASCPARCAWSVFRLLVGNGMRLVGDWPGVDRPNVAPNRAPKSDGSRARRWRLPTTAGWGGGQVVRSHRARVQTSRTDARSTHRYPRASPRRSPEPKPTPGPRDLRWAGVSTPLCPRPHRADLSPPPLDGRRAPRPNGGSLIAVSRSRRQTCRTTIMSPLGSPSLRRREHESDRGWDARFPRIGGPIPRVV
jgi:hypothetical protein